MYPDRGSTTRRYQRRQVLRSREACNAFSVPGKQSHTVDNSLCDRAGTPTTRRGNSVNFGGHAVRLMPKLSMHLQHWVCAAPCQIDWAPGRRCNEQTLAREKHFAAQKYSAPVAVYASTATPVMFPTPNKVSFSHTKPNVRFPQLCSAPLSEIRFSMISTGQKEAQ
jgi:hypothetical protein